jgi:DNA topoisomerase-1
VEGYRFSLRGRRVLEEGWMNAYTPYIRFKEFILPDLREGMSIPITKIGYRRRYTKAPKRFNPSSAIKLMEDKGIGTKATRTEIIYTLQKRGYIKGSSFEMTELGFAVAEILNHYCPAILSIELTRELEKDLESINSGELEADKIVQKTIQRLTPILESFKFHEKEIGRHINEALKADSVKIILASCPACNTGKMYINRNNKTGKRFASCTNYKSGCKQTYPLPQRGEIKTTGYRCQSCRAPIIEVQIQGRRLQRFCINYECTNKGDNREEEVINANQ